MNDEKTDNKGAGADPNRCDKDGVPLLLRSLSIGDMDYAQQILDAGADINATDKRGNTALINASRTCKELFKVATEKTRWLLKRGADPQIKNDDGNNALHIAAQHGSLDQIKLLVEAGISPNSLNSWGWTPLHMSTNSLEEECTEYLIQAGGDKKIKDDRGLRPIDMIKDRSWGTGITGLRQFASKP